MGAPVAKELGERQCDSRADYSVTL